MESELEKLRRLLSAGVISESEFTRAERLVRATQPADPPKQDVASSTENLPLAEPAEDSVNVAPDRAGTRWRRLATSVGAVGALAAVVLVAVNGRSDAPSSVEPAPQRARTARVVLTDQGVGPFAWGSTQPQVLAWLREQLGPEELLADLTHAACPTGVTGFVTWTSGYSFRAAFDENGLRGYHLFPGALAPSEMGWGNFVGQFSGPSDIRISTSLDDIRSRFPGTVLREGPSTLGDPSTVAAIIGIQGFGLTSPGSDGPFPPFHVRSMFAGRHACNDVGIPLLAPPTTPAPESSATPEPEMEPEPELAEPFEESPQSREAPMPVPGSEPEKQPTPAPAPPPAPQDGPFELGLFFGGWGDVGVSAPSPNARTFMLHTTLPVGTLIAYEVLPARRDAATQAWSVITDPQYARRGVAEVRGSPSAFMLGMEHWNYIEPVFDVTGYPCDLFGPGPDGCPMIARAWFALELEGPDGSVRQPQHVRDLVGELGEATNIIRAIPELFDLCSVEWFPGRCPTLIGGPQPRIELTTLMWD